MNETLKYKLLKEVFSVLNNSNQGKPSYKEKRRLFLQKLVKEVLNLKLDIKSFYYFNETHFYILLSLWKQQGNAVSTTINKISYLKWFLNKLDIEFYIPPYKELNLVKPRQKIVHGYITKDQLQKLQNTIVISVIDFQICFGLTRQESIRIDLTQAKRGNELFINRKLAFNSNDRIISIVSLEQKQAIEERFKILDEHKTLIDMLSETNIIKLINIELEIINVNPKSDLRRFYILDRYYKYQTAKFSDKEIYDFLIQDTGFKTKDALLKVIYS